MLTILVTLALATLCSVARRIDAHINSDMEIKLINDGHGARALSNAVFERRKFSDLTIDPPVGMTAQICDARFVNCCVAPGTCVSEAKLRWNA